MRKSFIALLLLVGVAAYTTSAFAEGTDMGMGLRLSTSRMALEGRSRAAALGLSATANDTIWVGYSTGPGVNNYWSIGAAKGPAVQPGSPGGKPRPQPNTSTQTGTNGLWTFDIPVHGDSLQGWWPVRQAHTNASGATLADINRPWWAHEEGNQADYVLAEEHGVWGSTYGTKPGDRTFGVIGVWHSDPGNSVAMTTVPGSNPHMPNWGPFHSGADGNAAWMGLRGHGDVTVMDPITGNPFNDNCLMYNGVNGSNTVTGNGTTKHLPGYGNQMDQMMYRDFVVDTTTNATTIDFDYRTAMSTDKDGATKTRTGWFEGDPILLDNSVSPGNFISAEAGAPANTLAPCDSFQVYIGQGEDGTFHPSTGGVANIYDPLHRWFNEVLNKNNRLWLMGVAGTTGGGGPGSNPADEHATLSITAAQAKLLAGHTGKVRLVFRVHTNRGFDDENIVVSSPANYNSNYAGAVELDNVKINTVVVGDFSTAGLTIDNTPTVSSLNAWKTTGKPPANFIHVVDVNTLLGNWDDLCGGPNGPYNICNLWHNTLSVGDADNSERAAGAPQTPEHNGRFGCISPTINLVTPADGVTVNGWNLNTAEATPTEDFYVQADIMSSLFDIFSEGDLYAWGAQAYPALQSDGTATWGTIRLDPFIFFFTDPACTINGADLAKDQAIINQGLLATSNVSGIPDSIRVFFYQYLTCYRFGVPDANCGLGGKLGLFDNMGMAIVDGVPAPIGVDIWFPYNDTFPFNDNPSAPNYATPGTAAFDTTSALMRVGLNVAQSTGDLTRSTVPGDSVVVKANGSGDSIRVDMLFRINPGPGNYVTAGNIASGLRRVPTATAKAVRGDASYWGTLMGEPGDLASPAGGVNAWDPLKWNSARCDTQKVIFFSNLGDGLDATGAGQSASWMSTFHEAELRPTQPLRTAWILSHKRPQCFVIDTTLSSLNASNVMCGAAPGYMTSLPSSYTGWNGDVNSSEGVSILPDGIFAPGTHVEYFFRRADLAGPNAGNSYLCPDTTIVVPQPGESSFDGHRWMEVNVLPDRWKDHAYDPTTNAACMLYVDWNDRRGDELAWVAVADTIGATRTIDRGNNNGYAAPGGTGDPNGHVNDPASRTYKNKQAGTTWDMYGVKASESIDTGAGNLGSRLSYLNHSPLNLTDGMDSKLGPSPAMLAAYYRMILLLTGDLNLSLLGPFANRSGDDVTLLENYLLGSTVAKPYGLLAGGNGYVEDASWNDGAGTPQFALITTYEGVDLNATFAREGYREVSGNPNQVADLIPAASVNPSSNNFIYAVQNFCTFTLDNLAVVNGTTTPNAVVGAQYQNVGANGPYIASVVNPGDPAHPWKAETEGWDIANMRTRFGLDMNGRAGYMYQVFTNVFGSLCTVSGTPLIALDVPTTGNGQQYVDFVGNFSNNPLRSGVATVRFGLAQSDRVEVDVYDVSGRQIRKLADRMFPAGEHTLTWDGVNDRGQLVPRGVYFTQVKYVNRHVANARKLTVLK